MVECPFQFLIFLSKQTLQHRQEKNSKFTSS